MRSRLAGCIHYSGMRSLLLLIFLGLVSLIFSDRLSGDDHKFSATIRAFDAESGKQINELVVFPSQELQPGTKPIRWQPQRAVRLTGEENRFEKFLEMRNFKLRIEAKGYLPFVTAPLTRQENLTLDVKMTPGSGIRGIVKQPDGNPAAGAQIVLGTYSNPISVSNGRLTQSLEWSKLHPSVESNPDGKFELLPECDNAFIVIVHGSGCLEIPWKNQPIDANTFRLIPWGKIAGELSTGFDGAKGVRIELQKVSRKVQSHVNSQSELTTDQAGHFTVDRIFPGDYLLSPGFEYQQKIYYFLRGSGEYHVEPGETVSVDLPRLGKVIAGEVKIPPGTSLNQDEVELSIKISPAYPIVIGGLGGGSDDSQNIKELAFEEYLDTPLGKLCTRRNITTDASGKFEVTGLPAGYYDILVLARRRSTEPGMKPGSILARTRSHFTLPSFTTESKVFSLPALEIKGLVTDEASSP